MTAAAGKDKTKKNNAAYFAILLAVFVFLPFLIYGVRQGFYWDDWCQLLLHEKYGDAAFFEYFSYDRPFSAWTHILFFPLCGNSPVLWHLLFSVIRFLGIWFTCLTLRKIFPEKPRMCCLAGLLMAIAPIFSQHYISVAYSQHFTDYLLFILSVYTLLLSAEASERGRSIVLLLLSFVFTLLHLSITEYFAVLELLKPVLLLFLPANKKQKGKQLLRMVFPVLIFAVYVMVRLNISKWDPNFSADQPLFLDVLKTNPMEALRDLVQNAVSDLVWLFFAGFTGLRELAQGFRLSAANGLVILSAAVLAGGSFLLLSRQEADKKQDPAVLCIAILWILFGMSPFWLMNENFFTTSDPVHADRCFLAASTGVCLLSAYLIDCLFDDQKRFALAASFCLFLFSCSFLYINRNAVYESEKQLHFYRQIAERIPGFSANTALVAEEPVFDMNGNFSTSSALNIIYAGKQEDGSVNLPVWIFGTREAENRNDRTFSVKMRNYKLTSRRFIYIIPDNKFGNCVWVMTPEDAGAPHLSDLDRTWAEFSDVSRIDVNASADVNERIFGREDGGWCAYYQRASLLRQKQDWDGIVSLYEEAREQGFSPQHTSSNAPFEWLPFIDGLRNAGRTVMADELAEACIAADPAYGDYLKTRN